MVSKPQAYRVALLAGVIAASMLCFEAAEAHLWANLALGGLVLSGCLFVVMRRDPSTPSDPDTGLRSLPSRDAPLTVLLDQVPNPLLRYSASAGLYAVNRAARALFGTDDLIVDTPQPLRDAIERSESGARPALRLFDRSYAVGLSEISATNDTIRLISLTDIQSEVRMAEATALRDLLRVLSHEIMNSLTPVASLAGVARTYLEAETSPAALSAIEALDILSHRASGLTRFVEAYRSLARLPEPILRPVHMRAFVADVIRVFEQGSKAQGVAIDLDLSTNLPSIDLDDALMAQALLNVLANAADATDSNERARRIRVSAIAAATEIRLCIADNGCGIPDDLRDQIFHAFVTTKPSGTGTGLNLARQIALAHGGDLVLQDGSDDWRTAFCFVFPTQGVHE